MTKITAIIPTFNEESNIQKAIDSVSFADEIIVIDSFSTDKTVAVVEKSSAILIQRKFDDFSSQKNFAIEKASNDWIFLIDADETVPKNLKEEILQTVNSTTSFDAFYIYRSFFFKNKKINFSGWRRDKVIRLFRKNSCKYVGKVHEEISTNGKIGFLKGKLNHYSYKEYNQYKNKLKKYAKLQALELLEKGLFVTPFYLFLKPFVRFFIQFVIQLGFLDGYRGFVISWAHAFGVWRRYVEVLNLKYKTAKVVKNPIENFEVNHVEKEVSIIIVNYKSWKHLKDCLNALTHFKQEKFTFEVVVVDNNSNDGKLKTFSEKYSQFKFIENLGNNGFANGCNLGAIDSVGKNMLFLNPDTIANEDAIYAMLNSLNANEDYGIVSCNQLNNSGSYEATDRVFPGLFTLFGITRAIYRLVSNETKQDDEKIFPDWVSGSVVFISRKWFQKINGWNEDYWMYFEDVDLCKKVRNANGEVVLLKNVNIIHNHGGASRININTSKITKSEVLISKHVYIHNHFKGLTRFLLLRLLIFISLVSKTIAAIIGICFFFIPKLKLNLYLFIELIKYYSHSLKKGTWLSKRSMNLPFKKE
ncbi:glycosyltransferase [Polaribacter uvawellassae]|uniref:glycosyltransferase n=1 Tax=Polaribacter uvawellassae TaxID=3133495 RepID=UPI0032194091